MPITVEHSPDIAAIAALAAIGGMGQARTEIPNISIPSLSGGGGGSGGGMAEVSMQGPNYVQQIGQLQLAKQYALPLEMEKLQQEAKAKAQQFEAQFTTQQRAEIARVQNGIVQAEKSGMFTPEQIADLKHAGAMAIAGIDPQLMPKQPGKLELPEGHTPQTTWKDETTGAVLGYDRNMSPRVLVAPDKMPEYLIQQRKRELYDKVAEARFKLRGVKVYDPSTTLNERPMKDIEIEAELERSYPEYRAERIQEALENEQLAQQQFTQQQAIQQQATQQQAIQQQEIPWWQSAAKAGMEVRPELIDLPNDVGYAAFVLDRIREEYGSLKKIPGGMVELQLAARQAANIIKAYETPEEGKEEVPVVPKKTLKKRDLDQENFRRWQSQMGLGKRY